jgi:DNA-binding NtrC family response regulator
MLMKEKGGCNRLLPYHHSDTEFDKDQISREILLRSGYLETAGSGRLKSPYGRILLMDDEDMIRNITGLMLMRLGYDSEVSQEGSEAILIYQQAMNSTCPFDAVILDLNVTAGLGGLDTIKALKAIDPQVKAIISSGFSNDPVMMRFKEYGFQGTLPKPYKMEDIKEELHKVVA